LGNESGNDPETFSV